MNSVRLKALGGWVLVSAILLGGWMVGRSRMERRDVGGSDRDKVIVPRLYVESGSTQSSSKPGRALRDNVTRVTPRLPAPKLAAHPAERKQPEKSPQQPSWMDQMFKGGVTGKLSPEQIATYLRDHASSASSLLAVARITGDRAFLQEALRTFPHDPQVLFDSILFTEITPAERRKALEDFCQAAPGNALADYLSALDHFENGRGDDGVRAMWKGFNKAQMDDYILNTVQGVEEAYLSAGYSRAQAAATAFFTTAFPQVSRLSALSRNLLDLQAQYAQAGDGQSAQTIAEMGVRLGTQIQQQSGHGPLIEEVVGIAIERRSLARIDPNAILEASGQTVAMRLKELEQRSAMIKELVAIDPSTLKEGEVCDYLERAKLYGEEYALRWLQCNRMNTSPGPVTP